MNLLKSIRTIRTLILLFIPPIVKKILLKLIRRPVWSGDFKTWDQAKSKCSGYESQNILDRVAIGTRSVKNGEAAFDRDGITFDKDEYSLGLMASLLYCISNSGMKLDLLDFGGALGSTYYQYRSVLTPLGLKSFKWNVVEQPHYVKIGIEQFADSKLSFFTDIAKVAAADSKPNILLMSASLQYMEHPFELLKDLVSKLHFEYVILDRISLAKKNRITIQNVPLYIYAGSYPCWFFREETFLSNLKSLNYELVFDYRTSDRCDDFLGEFKGFLFRRNSSS